jgi:bacteriorhodopsin
MNACLINYLHSYKLFTQTLNISITIQIITGLIEFFTLFINVKPNIVFLKNLLVIEFIVQMIELLFYIWLFRNINTSANITPKRYADWFITTPTMLFTLIMYLIYTNTKDKENITLYKAVNA